MIECELELAKSASGGATPEESKENNSSSNRGPGPDVKAGDHLKKYEDLSGYPLFPEGTTSLLSKTLTKDIFNKYFNSKDKFGYNFREGILSGC